MKKSYLLYLLPILCFFSCKPDKIETPVPAPKVLGLHEFSNTGKIVDAAYCDNGKVMVLSQQLFSSLASVRGVDENGNLWFENNFTQDTLIRYQAIAEGPDNGVILTGPPTFNIGRSLAVIGFDKNARKNWSLTTSFSDQNSEQKFMTRLRDGNYVVLDSRAFSFGSMQQFFTWFDAGGNVYRMRQIDVSGDVHWLSITETPDKGYLCSGAVFSNGTVMCVAKFSEIGELQWKYTHNTDRTSVGERSIGLEDGTTLVVGHDIEPGNVDGTGGVLLKLSTTGNVLWQKRFSENSPMKFHDIIADGNGGYILTGFGKDLATNLDNRVMLLSVSADGAQQWCKLYSSNGTGKRIFRRPDGGYMAVGDLLSQTNIFVLITDKDGKIE